MTTDQIKSLQCKKHIKIYKLSQLGMSNKEVATSLGTNPGHVYNALKKYKTNPALCEAADLVVV